LSWPITLEIQSVSPYSFRDSNCPGLFLIDSKIFALFNLETLTDMAYPFRESKSFALLNLETLTVLAYSFRISKSFALFF